MTGISKSFGGVRALDHVDFSVRYGEIHALLGENGAGKSTLLKILRGVVASDSGTIEIGGKPLSEYNADAVRRAGVAMIFQEMSLIPTLSVAQNIHLNYEPHDRLGLVTTGGPSGRPGNCSPNSASTSTPSCRSLTLAPANGR